MIVQAGTETLWELAQLPRILSYFILHQIITIEATPKRKLERLREPGAIEWGDTVPRFIFGLLVAVVYSAIVSYIFLRVIAFVYQSSFPLISEFYCQRLAGSSCNWGMRRFLLLCYQSLHPSSSIHLRSTV
jgi:hypothetical protein